MKKYYYIPLMILAVIILSLFSCKDNCKYDDIPSDVKPIDWNNYNDCYDVFYNYYGSCNDFKTGMTGKTIKCKGWVFVPKDSYSIDAYGLMTITSDPVNT